MKASIIFLILQFSFQLTFSQETIKETSKKFILKGPNGSIENWVAVYEGIVHANRWQEGEHSSWKHPIDTRTCKWEISTYVKRRVGFHSVTGDIGWRDDFETVVYIPKGGSGDPWYKSLSFQGENCGKAEPRFVAEVNGAKQALINSFQSMVDNDTQKLKKELENKISGVQVAIQ